MVVSQACLHRNNPLSPRCRSNGQTIRIMQHMREVSLSSASLERVLALKGSICMGMEFDTDAHQRNTNSTRILLVSFRSLTRAGTPGEIALEVRHEDDKADLLELKKWTSSSVTFTGIQSCLVDDADNVKSSVERLDFAQLQHSPQSQVSCNSSRMLCVRPQLIELHMQDTAVFSAVCMHINCLKNASHDRSCFEELVQVHLLPSVECTSSQMEQDVVVGYICHFCGGKY